MYNRFYWRNWGGGDPTSDLSADFSQKALPFKGELQTIYKEEYDIKIIY